MNNKGYVKILKPDHPRADKESGYVLEHIVIAEKALGRALPIQAVIHHVNGIRTDNRQKNLVICQDQAYHQLLHVRARIYQANDV